MSKGEIVLIPFPFTDLTGNKLRPALILHNDKKGEDCIVTFITSGPSKVKSKYEVPLIPNSTNGIKVPSIVKINKIATLQKKLILGKLGTLEKTTLDKIDNQLKNLFNIR